MKAAVVEHYDQPITVRDWPVPKPGDHEVLVRVVAAGVNPIDWKTIERKDRQLPFVAGQDYAGVVSALGSGVTKYRETDRVFGMARRQGAFAEYTIAPEVDGTQPIAKIADDVGDADAAALPTAGLTALGAVDWLGVQRGATVAVLGATGGVGSFAVQLARDRGARVIGTASAKNEAFAREVGVDEFVAYDREDVADAIRKLHPNGVDAVVDLVDHSDAIARTLGFVRDGGRIVSTIGALPESLERGIAGNNLVSGRLLESSHAGLRSLLEMLEQQRIRAFVTAEKPLEEVAQALELSRTGSITGKLVLTVD